MLTVSAPGVLANDADGDGDTLTAVLQSNPANGTVALNGSGGFMYTPNLNFNGTDTFTYSANDGTSNSQVTTATITVTPVNDTPVAADDSYVTDEDTTLTVVAPGVLTNDTDFDGPSLTAMLVTQPQHGTVQLGPLGSVVYVPDANFFGTDSFTYRATDGSAFSSLATVTITVNPVNDAPVGNADNFGTFENTTITVPAPGVLADDVDVEGDALTAVLYSTPGHGLLVFNGDGSFSYAPNAGYSGTDQFFYRASDGQALSALTTVTITIGSVDDAPVAADDSYFVFEDTVTTVPAAGVLSNDFDPEDDVLTATLISGASHGTVVLQLDGGFTYTPNPGFTGIDTFTYQANDGVSDSNVATVTMNVMPKNDEPLANEDFYSTDEEQPITVAAPSVLGNDFDDDGDALTALLRDNPLHGVVSLNGDGSFTYTPDEGFSGTDVLTYQANDGTTNSNVTTVTILVRPINDVPVAVNDTYIANEDTTLTVSAPGVLANDTDADGDALSSTLVVAPLHGTLILKRGRIVRIPRVPELRRPGQLHLPGNRRSINERCCNG